MSNSVEKDWPVTLINKIAKGLVVGGFVVYLCLLVWVLVTDLPIK